MMFLDWCCPCLVRSRSDRRSLNGLRRYSYSDREIKLLMLGLDNAGKTCTAKSLVGDTKDIMETAPTVGFSKLETKYKGFRVTIFDLGGSRGFRGLWPKYFHEVHGFIFVIDASDHVRLLEAATVFKDFLRDAKVRGKPLLLLCNKADLEDVHDELHVVEALNVEHIVNDAKCPTRIEQSTAVKSQGLRDGYKWLVKSIIANMADLGPRVQKDIEHERMLEEAKRRAILSRIEQQDREDDQVEEIEQDPPGFVPLTELKKKLEERQDTIVDREKMPRVALAFTLPPLMLPVAPKEQHDDDVDSRASDEGQSSQTSGANTHHNKSQVVSLPPISHPESHQTIVTKQHEHVHLDLEPIAQPKKRRGGLMKRLNNRTAPMNGSLDSKRSSSSGSGGGSIKNSRRDSQVIRAYS